MNEFSIIEDGSVTSPQGYTAAGRHVGIKGRKPDLALLVSACPAHTAAVFTQNRIQGATVALGKNRLKRGHTRAVIINSGNANACTGPQGLIDAERMATVTAEALNIDAQDVWVCSTGPIGIPLPMARIEAGIPQVVEQLRIDGGTDAARAIHTTDTAVKQGAVTLTVDDKPVCVGIMVKGAGMIEPNMATMLAFMTTDAVVEPSALHHVLVRAVSQSFNRITIDGDQSCNDTVLFLANGVAENQPLNPAHAAWPQFAAAIDALTLQMAKAIVKDGEGVTKCVTVNIAGAANDSDAELAARAVANSLLVKTSWFGCDPNWGRVIDAVGYSGAAVTADLVSIAYDDVLAVVNGVSAGAEQLAALRMVLKLPEFSITVNLGLGSGRATVYSCDCSNEYIRINSEYLT
ncbi:MAG: bifunctional glutamate N-acetyltransferase/amino-acid acetyltransferase ArgJ [Verrucomicrobia bacterium]|nr:bifunctional glutamate N-acetyltransferase/amino-acid acetyltransferase ArgJ [Verrucomicrobiota bacterium]